MVIFDEKIYAENIMANGYKTKRNQGIERCCLIRYLRYLGKTDEEIISILDTIPFERSKYLSRENILYIYNKLLKKASDFQFVYDIEVGITQRDKELIKSLSQDISYLAYVYLIYYKWAKNIKRYIFRYNNNIYVEYRENDIWRLANLTSKKVRERHSLDRKLTNLGIIDIKIFKNKTFIYVKENSDLDYAQRLKGVKFNHLKDAYKALTYEMVNHKYYKLCEVCGKGYYSSSHQAKYCDHCKGIVRKNIIGKSSKKTKKKPYYVYRLTFPNQEVYIGITTNSAILDGDIINSVNFKNPFIENIRYYGENNIEVDIIAEKISYENACKIKQKENQ